MGHGHHHGAATAAAGQRGRLALVLALTVAVLVAELVGAALSGSLALLADAGHMATDALGLSLALGAVTLAQRPARGRRTFGWQRLEILAAVANGVVLLLVCGYVAVLGAGVGLLMQTLVLAVQNDFPASDVGTATSANNFFREIGATLGIAAVGAIFTDRLTGQLSTRLDAAAAQAVGNTNALTPQAVHSLPEAAQDAVIAAYHHALTPIFGYMVVLFAVGLVLALLLPEKELAADTTADAEVAEPAV